ncbi:MAG: carboxypeptidase regulatory-like domain-containing protein, partial [Longimicrobiales bacterium]
MWRDKGIGGHALCLFLATALMGFARAPVSAQAIRGVVVDDVSLTTVPSALVRLVRNGEAGRGILSGDDGGFFLPVPEAGAYRLEVSGMGYETALSQIVYVDRADTLSVEFRVRPNAVLLQPITVVGRTRRGRSAFEQRRAEWDRGIFLTPAMVDSISPVYPA